MHNPGAGEVSAKGRHAILAEAPAPEAGEVVGARLVPLHDLGAGVDVPTQIRHVAALELGVVDAAPDGSLPRALPVCDARPAGQVNDHDLLEPVIGGVLNRDVRRRGRRPAEHAPARPNAADEGLVGDVRPFQARDMEGLQGRHGVVRVPRVGRVQTEAPHDDVRRPGRPGRPGH